MIQILPEEREAMRYHHMVVNYGEEFLAEKGLREEFIRFVKEKQKRDADDGPTIPK